MRVDWPAVVAALGTLFGAGALSKLLWPSLWGRSLRVEVAKRESDEVLSRISQSTQLAETAIGLYRQMADQQAKNVESIARLEVLNADLTILVAKQACELMEVRRLHQECEAGKKGLTEKLLATEREIVARQQEILAMRDRMDSLASQIKAAGAVP